MISPPSSRRELAPADRSPEAGSALAGLLFRPGLPRRAPDRPRPEDLADLWSGRAAAALQDWEDLSAGAGDRPIPELLRTSPELAFRLLAARAGLLRLNPGLLGRTEVARLGRLDRLLRLHGADLAAAALGGFSAGRWLEEAGRYLGRFEEDPPLAELVAAAGQLLEELDRAELVLATAGELLLAAADTSPDGAARRHEEASGELDRCAELLAAHLFPFAVAEDTIRTTCESCRTDGEAPELLSTVFQWIALLDEVERVQEELQGAGLPRLAPEEARKLVELAQSETGPAPQASPPDLQEWARAELARILPFRQAARRPPLLPRQYLAVGATPNPGTLLRWSGPAGRWQARVRLPPSEKAHDGHPLRLYLSGDLTSCAHALLGGVLLTLTRRESDCVATLTLGDLRHALQKLGIEEVICAIIRQREGAGPELEPGEVEGADR